jgi:phosphoribosylformimino-5-aminoimidazole carboxamide ribotide isomerase
MLIIPVIDLYKGIVVHAVAGNRKKYCAIESNLCSSPAPHDVINGFLDVFNFKSIYIADLDALEQQGDHVKIIESICTHYPNLEIWLDTGSKLIDHYLHNSNLSNLRLILSSESLLSVADLTSFIKKHPKHNFILSLDYKNDALLGPQKLLQAKQYWPKDIIVLNLNSVGAEQGSKFPIELNQHELVKDFHIYYGGGVRHSEDLIKLKSHNFSGALISTTLHKQLITSNDILSLNQ